MYPQTHFMFGLLFMLLLKIFSPLSPVAIITIFLASILIDVDHWFVYVKEKKDLSVKRAYNWFVEHAEEHKKQNRMFLCVFHTIESVILLVILSFFSQIIFYITIGFSFHLLFDFIYSYLYKKESRKPLSIIYWVFSNK